MDESDAACAGLRHLEQTLTGVRGRLADLALLVAGQAPAGAPPTAAVCLVPVEARESEVLPAADELCAQSLPEPLVLPSSVDASPVVVLDAEPHPSSGGAVREDAVSRR